MSRLIFALVVVAILATPGWSQSPDALRGEDRAFYEQLKRAEVSPDSDRAKAIIAKQAKYLVLQLTDPQKLNSDTLESVFVNAFNDLQSVIQRSPPRDDVNQERINFNRAMGQAMVAELKPLLSHQQRVVRLNANRMMSLVAQMGVDDVAEPALAVLADPKENAGVKRWAIATLGNLFAYVPEPNVPWKSAFRKETAEFERQAIVALCDFVLRSPDTKDMSPDAVAGIRYVRSEAVKALGFVRTHRLHHQGAVLAKPGWVLLKVANGDGIEPAPEPLERAMAIYSFTQLFPVMRVNVDRAIDLEFAADRIGAPLLELVTMKANPPPGSGPAIATVPWVFFGNLWETGLNQWQANAKASALNGAPAVAALHEHAKADLLEQLKISGGPPPDVSAFQQWFTASRTKSTQLYTDDPQSTVQAIK